MSAQRHCVCFRCIDDDHPNGKLISAKQYNRHRLQDAYMAVPLSKARQASPTDADYDHADYEDESPDSPGPTSPLPRSSPEPRSSSPYDEVSSQLGLDVEMDDLTDNLGRLNTGPKFDYMLQQRNLGAGAVWDVPDDEDGEPEQAMPGEDDDDEPIDREWDLAEDGFDWGLYERAGKDGRLTADDILDSLLVSEVANQDDALTEEDIAIARSYAWKIHTHTTDTAFEKMRMAYPQAFDDKDGLPGLAAHQARVASLSGIEPQRYHCCVNSCVCYVGPHAELDACPFCKQSRYRRDGKPRKIFTYIPLVPRLQALFRNREMAEKLQYRASYVPEEDKIKDVFDSKLYKDLCKEEIDVDHPADETMPKYFADRRDIALGLSTDGFAPFKRRKQTCWPLIVFLYNLPPEIRFHLENILSLGVIPGPNKPKDMCSFLYPLVVELWRLAHGCSTYDISSDEVFALRAFLILAFGDIPAVSMLMRMKGHNGFSPCRMCKITGVSIPDSTNKTLYIPCDRLTHPTAEEPLTYDPRNLPLRTHEEFYAQAKEVSDARTAIAADELARKYGIKGLPILYHVKSLRFPHSFPFDFMHLIWENLIPNLILLWTNEFKGLDHGMRDYTIDKAIWEAVGKQTAEAGDTIPGAFGARVPNMQNKGGVQVSAEMHATWTQFIAPTCLRNAFKDRAYYDHFVLLVQILTKCLQFDITRQELDWLRVKIPLWVEKYEEIYYQYDPRRLSTCTLTIHALLHIPDSIEMAGPQWCYWAYPMERFCGRLQPGIRNRRFPYPSLDRHVLETARITQIGMLYNISHELSMKHSRQEDPKGSARVDGYDAALLIGPHKEVKIRDIPNYTVLVSALATRWGLAGQVGDVKDILRPSFCTEWSKIRRVDSEAGDTMVAYSSPSSAMHNREDSRDATFVRYEMYTDRNERRRTVDVELQGEQFYGRLQHIYRINLNNAEPITTEPKSKKVKPITIPRWYSMIIVEVESCILTDVDKRLDLPFYKAMGRPHMTDATSLACVVGRVPDGQGGWGIVDRSGNLARAMYIDDL